jgi:bifunctional non-homologous end joining protein LigD
VKLREYRHKRSAEATNEPFGGDPPEQAAPTRRGAFVVHLHDATRTHYDLRIEVGHVLASFAVPHGPTLDPEAKHLAIHTEDHPLEYLDFEDVIPSGQYGAGPMIVWDRGRIDYVEAPVEEGLRSGKVDFVLDGYKLHGRFALVKTKSPSGKGNEWLLLKKKDPWSKPGSTITKEQPRSVLSALAIDELARATDIASALEADCAKRGAKSGAVDALALHPMSPTEAENPPPGAGWLHELALGGVRVVAGKSGDDAVLARGGRDVADLYPEVTRAVRALAPSRVVLDGEIVAFGDDGRPSAGRLAARIEKARAGDMHGAVLDAPVTLLVSDVLAIGERDLRALPLADRRAILEKLLPAPGILRATETFDEPAPLVAFCTEYALPGVLSRRSDSPYKGGQKPTAAWVKATVTDAEPVRHSDAPPPPPSRQVPVTNRHKIFWPDEGYTKGDLVDYYEAIAPAILPYLRERPIAVVRYPDGIAGKNFYQWNVPPGMPRWVSSFQLRDEESENGEKRVFLVNDLPSLVYIANLACLPIHVLACRASSLDQCDFFTIDFDVRLSSLARAVEQARTLEEILRDIGLVGFPKTSGQTGLHVLVPLGPGVTFATARALCDLLGRMIVDRHPEHATMERVVKKRGEKVYVDTGQTGPTRMIVCPYSVRAYPGAPVSTPLAWDEVVPSLDPKKFTIKTLPDRFAELGDPMRPLMRAKPNVPAAVKKLERLVGSTP